MHGTLTYAPALAPNTLHAQASAEVWDLVRDLEAVLPPAEMALVHKLRLAAEIVGSMRATIPTPIVARREAGTLHRR